MLIDPATPPKAAAANAARASSPAPSGGQRAKPALGREDKTMGSVTVKIPLVTWRDGRPRFEPGPKHRALGYRGQDLRHPPVDRRGRPVGAWFSLEEAIAWSKARRAEIAGREAATAARRSSGAPSGASRASGDSVRTMNAFTTGQLVERFLDQRRMKGEWQVEGRKRRAPLAANTVRYYRQARNLLERLDGGRIWTASAAAITARTVEGILDRIEVAHGLAQARAVRAMLSAAFSFGTRARLVLDNPVAAIEEQLPTLDKRVRYGSIDEMKALIAAADAIGRAEIGDSIMLGLMTGQRQNDRLALEAGQLTDDGILFRQGKKRGQPLLIPATPELKARLAEARRRRREWRVNWPHVVLDEVTRRPFEADWYRKVFREVRAAAVLSCASLADFRDQDLRDTAVTWLALAECNKFEIAAITGHSLKSIDTILAHYLGLHPELARSAIGKLVTYLEARA